MEWTGTVHKIRYPGYCREHSSDQHRVDIMWYIVDVMITVRAGGQFTVAVMTPGCTQTIDLRFQTLSVAVCSPEGGFEIRWSPGCSQAIDLRFQTLSVAVCS